MTRDAFFRHLQTPANRDFVVRCCPTWPQYYVEIVRHFEKVRPHLLRCGVTIDTGVTLEGLPKCFAGQREAVVLFAHWTKRSVELDSGLAGIDDIVSCVPANFTGVFDLCVCHPLELVKAVKLARRECLVRFTNTTATPAYWLHFYRILFETMQQESLSYVDALERTVKMFVPQQGEH